MAFYKFTETYSISSSNVLTICPIIQPKSILFNKTYCCQEDRVNAAIHKRPTMKTFGR